KKVLSFTLGQSPDLKQIEDALKKDCTIKAVAMVHHETSTGVLNPLAQISRLCRLYQKRLIVDGISSLGGECFDFSNVDVCVGSANKCIQGLPGAAFVLVRKKLIPLMRRYKRQSLYFDLMHLLETQEQGGTPFTPAIPTIYAFDAALKEFIYEGVVRRTGRYQQYSRIIRKGLEKSGLKYFVPNPSDRAHTLTAYFLPLGWTYPQLHDALKKEGYIIYAGQGDLSKKIFRIANMGWLKKKDLERLVMIFKKLGIRG
ncbi:MAG: aminotransferase class V-fold PLP-dependent enzyme, partial [Chlamydiota bacterium]|nr:aminotransferase class V-fold PLP-dependent enzyme [Chlamydiota bacterium]